jgi:dual specificity tyrosine-phosphorylation-regulated kinase 2/3/4
MWSFGCIIAELFTGRPLFPALDENELLEFFILIIGEPTENMIQKAKKRSKFYSKDGYLIRSQKSRLIKSSMRHFPLEEAVNSPEKDFLDFLKVFLSFFIYTLEMPDNRSRS